ncbi:PhnD/SsuA/transferrin family substrate-binding protein [Arcobacter sp. YIC-310]|uniref:PhnD/SsuA/transferrin family substrate-binding protein n=1 Tax=Arcobacter sp. YIC-310 TaxID=3376632 RepID=UPI003C273295
MTFLLKTIIILSLTLNLYSSDKNYKFESTYGFTQNGTILNRFKDARVAMKTWLEDIAESYEGKLTLRFYDNDRVLYNDFKKGKVEMIVLNLPFYFKYESEINKDAINLWSIAMSKDRYIKYYLITSKDSGIKSFKDIKNKSISINITDNVGSIWLDKNSLVYFKASYKDIFSEVHLASKESTALLNVFFKKRDLAVVTKKTWDTMIELNPGILDKIKIIEETKQKHLPFIGFFSKYANKTSIDTFFELSENLKELKGSRQIIELLKFDSVFKVEKNSLTGLKNYYREYEFLKKKYK